MEWIPPLIVNGACGVAVFLARNLIITRLTKSVEHDFNVKLEQVRGEARLAEERFRQELRTKGDEIATLRSGAVSALANRQVSLYRRQLEAVDQLWSCVIALSPARNIAHMMSHLKFDALAKEAGRDQRIQKFVEAITGNFDPAKVAQTKAFEARPFVSEMVWAVYSAISAISMTAAFRMLWLNAGMPGGREITKVDSVANLIKAVLPHQAGNVDQFGPDIYAIFLDELDARLLQEFKIMLSGTDSDKSSIEQAARILSQANSIMQALEAQKAPQ